MTLPSPPSTTALAAALAHLRELSPEAKLRLAQALQHYAATYPGFDPTNPNHLDAALDSIARTRPLH